jgi:hypothetical protein
MGRVIGFMKLIWWNSLLFCLQPFTEFWTSIVSFDCSDVSFVFCVMSMRLFSILLSVFSLLFYFVCVEAMSVYLYLCVSVYVLMFFVHVCKTDSFVVMVKYLKQIGKYLDCLSNYFLSSFRIWFNFNVFVLPTYVEYLPICFIIS